MVKLKTILYPIRSIRKKYQHKYFFKSEKYKILVDTDRKKALDIIDYMTMDIVSFELKNAWLKLGEISGVNSDENILDAVFSKFCLGK